MAAVYVNETANSMYDLRILYIDKMGKEITSQYNSFPETFVNGLARVKVDADNYIYIDTEGNEYWKRKIVVNEEENITRSKTNAFSSPPRLMIGL